MNPRSSFTVNIASLAAGLTWAAVVASFFSASITASASEAPKRQKIIDFEDQIVEGMNKRPLDSLNQLSEKQRRKNQRHLYRKRGGFRTEVALSLDEMRLLP